jgi:hypothetical protein
MSIGQAEIYKLPVEVWQQVFQYCTEPDTFTVREISMFPMKVPNNMNVNLSHVCRYFRNISLSMPLLWSILDLSHSKAQLDTFLERSLQVNISIIHTGYPLTFSIPLRHANTLEKVHHRIIRVENVLSYHNRLHSIEAYHRMQHLMITGTDAGGFGKNIKETLEYFKDLQTLVWHVTPHSSQDVRFSSQIQYNLTSLRLGSPHQETFILGLLRCCPVLEAVRVWTVGSGRTETEAMVSLPRLKILQVHLEHFDDWLSNIETPPTLESCTLDFRQLVGAIDVGKEWQFWPVSLDLGRHSVSAIIPWLANKPGTLKKLTLTQLRDYGIKIYLKELRWPDGRLSSPSLEELRIACSEAYKKESESDLLELHRSRIKAGLKPLRILWGEKLFPCPSLPEEPPHNPADGADNSTSDHRRAYETSTYPLERSTVTSNST